MTTEEKARELVDKFYAEQAPVNIHRYDLAIACALICVANEYHALREQLYNLRACRVISSENTYLKRLEALTIEEGEIKQEIEKL